MRHLTFIPIESDYLTPFIQSQDERVIKAQRKLQQSSEELRAVLKKCVAKFGDFPSIGDEFAEAALASKPGETFGQLIGHILAHQKGQETVAQKVGDCMAKVFPVMRLALRLIATGSDVS